LASPCRCPGSRARTRGTARPGLASTQEHRQSSSL
jgi:hypothetical protein